MQGPRAPPGFRLRSSRIARGRGAHYAGARSSGSTPPPPRGGPPAPFASPFAGGRGVRRTHGSYLVDSASSHMLVSKIKPCMSKYKQLYRETANGSLNQLSFIRWSSTWITVVILELIHAKNPDLRRGVFIR